MMAAFCLYQKWQFIDPMIKRYKNNQQSFRKQTTCIQMACNFFTLLLSESNKNVIRNAYKKSVIWNVVESSGKMACIHSCLPAFNCTHLIKVLASNHMLQHSNQFPLCVWASIVLEKRVGKLELWLVLNRGGKILRSKELQFPLFI